MLLNIKERIAQASVKQWIKCAVWSLVFILFIVWVGNFWWLLLLLPIFDLFITKIIPWSWWKNLKNSALRTVMSWVDAIVFALVAAYFVFAFVFQNYQIPSSSLEKTLLVGDFLLVSKAHYGPRVPMTPLSFPLAQHTMPIVGGKSYIEKPQWEYRRLKGLTSVKHDDIVVFNFPTGDSVPENLIKTTTNDYYAESFNLGKQIVQNDGQQYTTEQIMSLGRDYIKQNPRKYGKIIYRPVDRRENYVKRCVGLAGDTLQIIDNQVIINGKPQAFHEGIQFSYFVQTSGGLFSQKLMKKIGISYEDFGEFAYGINPEYARIIGLNPQQPVYRFPLTQKMLEQIKAIQGVTKIVIEPADFSGDVFPLGNDYGWNRDNYGPVYIPKRGDNLPVTLENLPIYERLISVYEHNKLAVKDSIIYINGEPATHYSVKMDYYFMMGDNRHNSLDSRYWGFVPEDHIVGCPLFVWLSLDKDKGLFEGKIRWNRFFKGARN